MMQSLLMQITDAARAARIPMGDLTFVVRRQYLIAVLKTNNLNQVRTARDLAVHRNTVARLLGEYKISLAGLRDELLSNKKPVAADKPLAAAAKVGLGQIQHRSGGCRKTESEMNSRKAT